MTCYIDSSKKYHIDANITPEGWRVGVFAWTVAKNNELLQIIRNSNYDLIEDDGNHRIIYMNNFYTSLDEISDKVIELYNYFEKEMTKDLYFKFYTCNVCGYSKINILNTLSGLIK